MPVRVGFVDGIVSSIGVPVGSDALEDGIPVIGRDEAAEGGVHVTGVEIHQPRFGIMPLVDVALLRRHRRVRRLAIGRIGRLLDEIARRIGDEAHRRQVVAVDVLRAGAHQLDVHMRIAGIGTERIDAGRNRHSRRIDLGIGIRIERVGTGADLADRITLAS